MASIIDVVQGISQAAANAYDGALDENGEPLKVGLKREEGEPLLDERVMDGFGIRFHGPLLCIHYHSEIQLKEVHGNNFESEIESKINDVAGFLKKEYKKITGDSVSLTAEGEADILVQSMSRVRSWVQAYRYYKIGGLDEVVKVGEGSEDSLEANYKSFLDQGGFLGKRPSNDTRKK